MATSQRRNLGPRQIFNAGLAASLLFLNSSATANSQEQSEGALPEIVSADMIRLDRKITPEDRVRQQSGERQLVSALFLDESTEDPNLPDQMPWLTNDFELMISEEPSSRRICVDFSNGGGTFRATYLMKLVASSSRVKLKVDYPKDRSLIGAGGTFVAYPASDVGNYVDESCDTTKVALLHGGSKDEIVYPARVTSDLSGKRQLFIKLNSGGADVVVRMLDIVEQVEVGTSQCYIPTKSNGTYDRECKLDVTYPIGPNLRLVMASIGADDYRELTIRIPD